MRWNGHFWSSLCKRWYILLRCAVKNDLTKPSGALGWFGIRPGKPTCDCELILLRAAKQQVYWLCGRCEAAVKQGVATQVSKLASLSESVSLCLCVCVRARAHAWLCVFVFKSRPWPNTISANPPGTNTAADRPSWTINTAEVNEGQRNKSREKSLKKKIKKG